MSSIFLSSSGEWKLGGFELFSDPAESNAIIVVRFYSSDPVNAASYQVC